MMGLAAYGPQKYTDFFATIICFPGPLQDILIPRDPLYQNTLKYTFFLPAVHKPLLAQLFVLRKGLLLGLAWHD